MKENSRSSGGLVLMEVLIAILVFAFCSGICVQIFAASRHISKQNEYLSQAIVQATSGAECFKACAGDLYEVSQILGGEAEPERLSVGFDADEKTRGDMIITIRSANENYSEASVDIWIENEIIYSVIAGAGGERR